MAELRHEGEEAAGGRLHGLTRALRRAYGGAAGDAERYLARVFHGTATPAELVAALSAVRDFAASAQGMREEAVAKWSSSNRDEGGGDDGLSLVSGRQLSAAPPIHKQGEGLDGSFEGLEGSFEALAHSPLLRELLSSAADPATSEVCRRPLSLDLEP